MKDQANGLSSILVASPFVEIVGWPLIALDQWPEK